MPEAAAAGVSLGGYFRLIRSNANFRRLWLAQIVSQMGDWFYVVAVYDLVFRLTGSAQLVGLVIVVQILPFAIMGPTAGAVNDRLSRRKVMIAADMLRAVIVLGMANVQTLNQLWLLYLLLAVEVSAAAFFEPARAAVIPNVVSEPEVTAANALSSATWSAILALGAGLGGIAVHWLGRETAFVLDSMSFLGSAALIARMRFSEQHLEARGPLRWLDVLGLGPILEGIRYLRQRPRLASLLILKGGVGLFGVNWVLLPILGERQFRVRGAGVLGIGTLFAVSGTGALLGPLLGNRIAGSSQRRMRHASLAAFVLGAASYALLAPASWLPAALACLIAGNAAASAVWVFSTTLLQLNTEDRFRGRVFSADIAINTLLASLSSYGTGFAIDRGLTLRTVEILIGCVLLLPALAWALALRLWRDPAPQQPMVR